jgi:transposase-like protein
METLNGLQDTAAAMFQAGRAPSEIMQALGVPPDTFYAWFDGLMRSGALDGHSDAGGGIKETADGSPQTGALEHQLQALGETVGQYQKAATDALSEHLAALQEEMRRSREDNERQAQALTQALGAVLNRLRGEVPVSVLRRIFARGLAVGVCLVVTPLGLVFGLEPAGTMRVAARLWQAGYHAWMWVGDLW